MQPILCEQDEMIFNYIKSCIKEGIPNGLNKLYDFISRICPLEVTCEELEQIIKVVEENNI